MRFFIFKPEPLKHDPDHIVYLEKAGKSFTFSPVLDDAFLFSSPEKATYICHKYGGHIKAHE